MSWNRLWNIFTRSVPISITAVWSDTVKTTLWTWFSLPMPVRRQMPESNCNLPWLPPIYTLSDHWFVQPFCKCSGKCDLRLRKDSCSWETLYYAESLWKNNRICIQIANSYLQEPVFENEIPISHEPNHGLGTKSMISVVENITECMDFCWGWEIPVSGITVNSLVYVPLRIF